MKTIKVFFFGDSICIGQFISMHKGWVTRTSARLAELGQKYNCKVIVANASANGRTTRQALEVMPYEIQSQHPDVLIVQFGMNDCNYWESDRGVPRVNPKAFAANLEEIITRALNFGVQKILLNTNHPTGRDQQVMHFTDISYQQSNERYNQLIREVSKNLDPGVILNDTEKAFKKHANGNRERLLELLLPNPDFIHLSEAGHNLYFKAVYPKIESIILKLMRGQSKESL